MDITIQALEVGKPNWVTKGRNKYQELTLRFKGDKGEQTRKFVSFAPHTDIFNAVKDLTPGSTYSVRIEKEGDFWNWKAVTPATTGSNGSAPATYTAGGGSRVSDEVRQSMIVRQSSIANAVNLLGSGSTVSDVLETAEKFYQYVMTGEVPLEDHHQGGTTVEERHEEAAAEEAPTRKRRGVAVE